MKKYFLCLIPIAIFTFASSSPNICCADGSPQSEILQRQPPPHESFEEIGIDCGPHSSPGVVVAISERCVKLCGQPDKPLEASLII